MEKESNENGVVLQKSFTIENDLKGKKWYFWVGIAVFLYVFYKIMFASLVDSGSSYVPAQAPEPSQPASVATTFSVAARARFDDILKSSPELEAIQCEGSCDSVVYFDYKTVPSDLEFVIRGNATTFSKFKLDQTGVSHVSVVARKDGKVLLSCRADHGSVSGCE